MLNAIVNKVKDVGYNRCGKCPAFWESVDYWGEADAGCTLHRDYLEFCPLSLLPNSVMNRYVKFKEGREERHWNKIYERDWAKFEQEEDFREDDTP